MDARKIIKGVKLYHIPTKKMVTLCNCASVPAHRKVSYAKTHSSEYLEAQDAPKPQPV